MKSLRANLVQLAHLLIDTTPSLIASTHAYTRVRRALSGTPERFTPVADAAEPRRGGWLARKFACPGLDLVVEGFPGSANSYVSNSLRSALPATARVVSHFHYTVQIKRSLVLDLPVLIVVREPRGACLSLKSKQPELWNWVIVLRWLLYHRYVWRNVDRLDVVLFDEVIADLSVIRRRSATVNALLEDRRLEEAASLRRASAVRRSISTTGVSAVLLQRADRLYERFRAEVDAPIS